MLNSQHQPPISGIDVPYLAPTASRIAEFNFLLRQFEGDYFHNSSNNRGFFIFSHQQQIPLSSPQDHAVFEFQHVLFAAVNRSAYQLEIKSTQHLDTQYFTVPLALKNGSEQRELIFERDFDRCVISTAQMPLVREEFIKSDNIKEQSALTSFLPLPPFNLTLLSDSELGYICFCSERIGAYPKQAPGGWLTTHVRGFYGSPGSWNEFDEVSAIRCGGGHGNWRFGTALGEFFVPGGGSFGEPTYTPRAGPTRTIIEYEEREFSNPENPAFDLAAFKAFRSLGIPAYWPPSELLAHP